MSLKTVVPSNAALANPSSREEMMVSKTNAKTSKDKDILFFAALSVVYLLTYFFMVSPRGEFPIGDDMVYSQAIKDTLSTGALSIGYSAQPCYLHILVGTLASKVFGFSYCLLRVVSMLWTLLGCAGLFLTFRTIGLNSLTATIFSAAYLFSPLIYFLSLTFMTDSSGLALSNWYMFFLLRGLRKQAFTSGLLLSSMFLMFALSCRVFPLVFLAATTVALVIQPKRKLFSLSNALSLLGPLMVGLGLPLIFQKLDPAKAAASAAGMSLDITNFAHTLLSHTGQTLMRIVIAAGQLAIYLGVFCTAALSAFISKQLISNPKLPVMAWLPATVLLSISVCYLVGVQQKLMPFNYNILTPPFTSIPAVVGWPLTSHPEIQAPLTTVSIILGFAFICAILNGARHLFLSLLKAIQHPISTAKTGFSRLPDRSSLVALAVLASGFAFLTLLIVAHDLDRYYSMLIAPALLCLGLYWRKSRINSKRYLSIMSVLVILIGAYSVSSVHDCLYAYRARWKAISDLVNSGIDPKRIDQGWEYNMMVNPGLAKCATLIPGGYTFPIASKGSAPLNKERWWPVSGDDYVISHGQEFEGYKIVSRYYYSHWVTGKKRAMFSLKKVQKDALPKAN